MKTETPFFMRVRKRPALVAVGILCGLLLVAGSFSLDGPVREAVVAGQGKNWKKSGEAQFHRAVRRYGDWPFLMVGCGVVLGCARLRGSQKWTRLVVAAMVASTLTGLVANTSRLTTGRTRPRAPAEVKQGFYGPYADGRILIGDSTYNSFPSGHVATAFGLAVPVAMGAPVVGIFCLGGAGLVAWSSIALGAHHPSDVVVSVLLSIVIGYFVWKWTEQGGLDRVTSRISARLRGRTADAASPDV